MEEVSVTRCNKPPEWARENRVFEHEGHLIRLGEAPAIEFSAESSKFWADIQEMCWISETGEYTEMTADEKKGNIREIKKWNKTEKRKGGMRVKFVDTGKGIYALSPKQQNMLGVACVVITICMIGFAIATRFLF